MFELVEDSNNLTLFTLQTIIIVFVALPIVSVDIIFQKYRNKYSSNMLKRNMLNMIQIIISIFYVYIIMKIHYTFSRHIQTTLPGIFFPGILFSLQSGMFGDIYNNVKSKLLPTPKV